MIFGGIALGFIVNPFVGALLLGLGVLALGGAWLRQWSSEFAVTNRRVIVKVGFISRRTIEINLSKVESVEVNQDILARMFNYGTILVIGTGGTKEPFSLIDDPLAFRRAVQSQQN
ncbi:MAG: PH domain-containing protein [Alphaproteobacteria bacterium]|nr:PH domain-containing protein [Alphaproteobacteria bacterium]